MDVHLQYLSFSLNHYFVLSVNENKIDYLTTELFHYNVINITRMLTEIRISTVI